MLLNLNNGYWLATGTLTRDAKLMYVGSKQTPKTSFSFAAGKRKDTTTIFVDCVCWRSLALATSIAAKGDSVAVIGTIEEREYNGKTYKDLVCEWANVAAGPSFELAQSPLPDVAKSSSKSYSDSGFMDALADADESELPF